MEHGQWDTEQWNTEGGTRSPELGPFASLVPSLSWSLVRCVVTRFRVNFSDMGGKRQSKGSAWDAAAVMALRRHMKLSQDELAAALGTRQQTVSEWETGRYRPRGASATLLTIIAERADFRYEASKGKGEIGKEDGGRGEEEGAIRETGS
jgi:DNA-binding transcriptional regulator YiaG